MEHDVICANCAAGRAGDLRVVAAGYTLCRDCDYWERRHAPTSLVELLARYAR